MKNNRNIIITFDTELFLGSRSGRPEGCILEPVRLVSEVMRKNKTRGIFFMDTTYLCKLRELSSKHPSCREDLRAIQQLLVQVIEQGHYVLPHIHPHWLDAIYLPEKKEFDLSNTTRYRFHKLTADQRKKVFSDSIEILQETLLKDHPDYKIDGFRAGGWCIQPFHDFKPYFEKFGIQYDMSVITGLYQFSTAQEFDFTDAPDKFIYRFSEDVNREDREGPFIQVCGSIVNMPASSDFFHRIHRKLINKTGSGLEYGSGQGQVPERVGHRQPASKKGYDISDKGREFASLEKMGRFKLPVYLGHLHQHHYLHLISHPKMINRHQVSILGDLLAQAQRDAAIETDYHVISENYLKAN